MDIFGKKKKFEISCKVFENQNFHEKANISTPSTAITLKLMSILRVSGRCKI